MESRVRRFSGSVVITIVYSDESSRYACRIKTPEGNAFVTVGSPASSIVGVDHPTAFDDAARAALSFADDEDNSDVGIDTHAAFDETGYYIARSKLKAWPSETKTKSQEVL